MQTLHFILGIMLQDCISNHGIFDHVNLTSIKFDGLSMASAWSNMPVVWKAIMWQKTLRPTKEMVQKCNQD